MRFIFFVAAAIAITAPVSAATNIAFDSNKRWAHKPTGVALPPTLAGLPRSRLAWFSAPEVDVAGEYWSADGKDTITVYLYRNVSADVPVWIDRARFYIMTLPEKYGAVTATGLRPFTPRGQSVTSGLMETYQISKTGRSSALAILPFNGFYAKFRVTSKTRDLAGIEAILLEAVNSFDWSSKAAQPSAIPVVDCATPLAARGPAKLVEGENRMMAGILGGLFAQVGLSESNKNKTPLPPPIYCREPGSANLTYGLYRANGHADHYTLAIHDGGRAITVGRNGLTELIKSEIAESEGKKDDKARFTVNFVHMDKIETYSDFASLPLPDQAIEQTEKTRPVSIAGTWGKKSKEVTITTD